MNIKKFAILTSLIITSVSAPVFADIFYWPSEYKSVYDDKVAIELKYDSVRKEYAGEKMRLESKIHDLDSNIESLNDRLAALEKQRSEDLKISSERIKELEKQNSILKSKGSSREKELIEENRKLNERLTGEIKKLRDQLVAEQNEARTKLEASKVDYGKKIAALQVRIDEQNDVIANLKKLSETQKAELNRLSQQASEIEKQLSDEIKKGQIRLQRLHDRIIVNLDDKISFDSGSSKLKPEIKKALDKLNAILINYPENRIYIEGNTDNVPIHNSSFRSNWQLSTERALSVLEYLLENANLNPARLSAVGNGEFNPQLSNDSSENRGINRRVDIIIIPKVSAK